VDRAIFKGIISTVVGTVVFGLMFFWDKNGDMFNFIWWSIVSGILGYIFISHLLCLSKKQKILKRKLTNGLRINRKNIVSMRVC
jgi:uncharacterized membrane protein YdcZ (DUF606 family)